MIFLIYYMIVDVKYVKRYNLFYKKYCKMRFLKKHISQNSYYMMLVIYKTCNNGTILDAMK